MKKNKYFLFIGIVALVTSCNLSTPKFELDGTLANMPDDTMLFLNQLSETNPEEVIKLDSTLVKNGQFKFEGKIKNPTLGFLSFKDQKGKVPLFIEQGKIHISINQDNFNSTDIKGTVNNEALSDFERNLNLYKYNLLSYQGQQQGVYMEALEKNDQEKIKEILEAFKKIQEDQAIFITNYLDTNDQSLTSLYYLYLTSSEDLTQLTSVYNKLAETDKKSNLAQLVALKLK